MELSQLLIFTTGIAMIVALVVTSIPYNRILEKLHLDGYNVLSCAMCATFWTLTIVVGVCIVASKITPYGAPIAIGLPTLLAELIKRWITK